MPAVTSIDADAFMRKYLEQPSDTTARLVFADWLEEQGEPHNRAWAYYIRLKAEIDRYPPDSAQRHELDRQAGEYAVHIRARLTIPAALFVGYPKSLLQLLPAPYLTVSLSRFTARLAVRELLPESVARENLLFPLDVQGDTLLLAAARPTDLEVIQRLEFILNHNIVLVGADADDVRRAINREYGQTDTDVVDSVLLDYTNPPLWMSTAHHTPPLTPPEPSVVRLVNLLLLEAINQHADRVLLDPTSDALIVRYRVGGAWVERDNMARRFLRPVFERLAVMAGIDVDLLHVETLPNPPLTGVIPFAAQSAPFDVHVTIQASPVSPSAELVITPA